MTPFEKLFAALCILKPGDALEAANEMFKLITGSSTIKSGYELIALYHTINLYMTTASGKDSKELIALSKIKDAVVAQIRVIRVSHPGNVGLFGITGQRNTRFSAACSHNGI